MFPVFSLAIMIFSMQFLLLILLWFKFPWDNIGQGHGEDEEADQHNACMILSAYFCPLSMTSHLKTSLDWMIHLFQLGSFHNHQSE